MILGYNDIGRIRKQKNKETRNREIGKKVGRKIEFVSDKAGKMLTRKVNSQNIRV